jgi:hypothetical protein
LSSNPLLVKIGDTPQEFSAQDSHFGFFGGKREKERGTNADNIFDSITGLTGFY